MLEVIKETRRLQKELYEKFQRDIQELPFYNLLEKGKVYRVKYKEYREEKSILIKYEGAMIYGGTLETPQIMYLPLKKDLTTYEGRRGYSQSLPIRYIVDFKEVK